MVSSISLRIRNILRKQSDRTVWWNMQPIAEIIMEHQKPMWKNSWQREIQGALKIKEKFPESLLIFLTPPSAGELKKRLEGRGTETQEVIEKRLARAVEESEGVEAYDYIVVNDDLEECVEEVHRLVDAARRVPVRCQNFINEIREELKEFKEGEK